MSDKEIEVFNEFKNLLIDIEKGYYSNGDLIDTLNYFYLKLELNKE